MPGESELRPWHIYVGRRGPGVWRGGGGQRRRFQGRPGGRARPPRAPRLAQGERECVSAREWHTRERGRGRDAHRRTRPRRPRTQPCVSRRRPAAPPESRLVYHSAEGLQGPAPSESKEEEADLGRGKRDQARLGSQSLFQRRQPPPCRVRSRHLANLSMWEGRFRGGGDPV